ncbi:hypothetical protein [Vreelandella jeotgali]|uniref:hypothetical protein n=1 Tax=Vreelandella jeotgali TaxID=553386 RepID=UPI00034D971B|nr:hypothetical protein [Halomonas jeotgali]
MLIRLIALAASLAILGGCATTAEQCNAANSDASMLTKLSCDAGGGYRKSINEGEQQVRLDRQENALFREIYAQIKQQQRATRNRLDVTRDEQQRLQRSVDKLVSRLQKHTDQKLGLQQKLNALEDEAEKNDKATMEDKQEHLEELQGQVKRLQESLGY